MEETHERFLSFLDASEDCRWKIAKWLSLNGYTVRVPPLMKSPTHADWKRHSDSGDLEITRRVEVKQLSASFTCREDWPFRDKFIVCNKHSFDAAVPKPYGYIIVNREGTHAAIVLSDTSHRWGCEQKRDSRYGENVVQQHFYMAPLDCVRFVALKGQP